MHPAFFAYEYEARAKKMAAAAERARERGNQKKADKFAKAAERYKREAEMRYAELENMGVTRPDQQ